MPSSIRSLLVSGFCSLAIACGSVAPASAQDSARGLGDALSEWLGATQSDARSERRVPFGQQEVQLSYAPLVKAIGPAVVNVYASQTMAVRSPLAGDPFFEQFFGRQTMPPRVQSSLGSGVIVDPQGYVVTNYHVIRGATEVRVATSDGREFTSKILLKDESLDLAVLKIDGSEPFPSAPMGDSDALEVGDLVLAIGNPFGVGQTTTSGIISALARTHIGVNDFGFFIQTDAAINPGNSGGGLINMAGQVIGINTAIYSQSGGSIGIGFAIPSNIVQAVVQAAQDGLDYFERPFVGATFENVSPQIAEALGMARPTGALVKAVMTDGPSATAGLRPGDVVLAMNGASIEHPDALGYRLAIQPIGSVATLSVLSQGSERQLEVEMARAPEGASTVEIIIDGRSPFAGAKVAAMSPRLAQRLNLSSDARGVAVLDVDRSSPAGRFGLRPRDIVLEVNGVQIDTAEKLREVASSDSRWWRFSIDRGGQVMNQVLRY